jgi:hypothetical protein
MTEYKCFLNERGDQKMLEMILIFVLMALVLLIQFETYSIPPSTELNADKSLPEESYTISDEPLDLIPHIE